MPKLMVIRIIMSLGAVLLSTAPISQTFAQVKQQEAQASGIAVADTLSNSSAADGDNLQLLRPGATAIFPVADSAAAFESVAAVPAAKMSSTAAVGLVLLVIIAALALFVLIGTAVGGGCCGPGS